MNYELRVKIDKLIKLSRDYINQQPSELSFFGDAKPIFAGNMKSPVIDFLEKMSVQELIYVMALMWYGRGSDDTFESLLIDAQKDFTDNDYNKNISYMAAKPLGDYLSKGLQQLNQI